MSKTKCYAPTKTDRELASSKMATALGWNAHLIAALRGMYEENNESNTIDNIVSLIGYHNKLKDQERKELYDYINNPIAAWSQLKEAFPSTQMRSDRYRMVALLFSRVVDSIIAKSEKQGVNLSREDVILGFKDKEGHFQYGPAKILNLVWEQLQEVKNKAQEAGDMEVVEKYQTIFKNWGALIQYALKDIKMNEGINIGHNLTFAVKSSSEEGYILDLEETTKERWQERVESISPLGSTSVPVRRSLGRLYAEETTDRDDLGFPRMNNISETHQKLLQILKGMESETHMLELIQNSSLPFANTLLKQLQADPVLRTQYFVDFKKFELDPMECAVYIAHYRERERFNPEEYLISEYGNYFAAYPRYWAE